VVLLQIVVCEFLMLLGLQGGEAGDLQLVW
jgi:hypothetical protein